MLDAAFDALKQLEWGADPAPLAPIHTAIISTHGDAAGRAELEKRLLAVLQSEAGYPAKDFCCRKLMLIGTDTSVAVLASMLADSKLSHLARYALERIPTPAAATALRSAVATLPTEQKIGAIASLGVRKDAGCVADLGQLVSSGDTAVAIAAAQALGAIRSPQAAQALQAAKPADAVKPAVTDASFACAETFLAQGQKPAALMIYTQLHRNQDLPKHVRLAVQRGILACAGK